MSTERKIRLRMDDERREFYAMSLQQLVDDFPYRDDLRLTILRLGRPDARSYVSLSEADVGNLLELAEDVARGYGYAQSGSERPLYKRRLKDSPYTTGQSRPRYPLGKLTGYKEPVKEILQDKLLRRGLVEGSSLGPFLLNAVMDSESYKAYPRFALRTAVTKEAKRRERKALRATERRLLKKLQASGKAYEDMTDAEKRVVSKRGG